MKIEITSAERTTIVAALVAYGERELAVEIVGYRSQEREPSDPTDDGPEVPAIRKILRILRREHYDYTEGNGARDSRT